MEPQLYLQFQIQVCFSNAAPVLVFQFHFHCRPKQEHFCNATVNSDLRPRPSSSTWIQWGSSWTTMPWCQVARSNVVSTESYRPDTHRVDRLLYMAKMWSLINGTGNGHDRESDAMDFLSSHSTRQDTQNAIKLHCGYTAQWHWCTTTRIPQMTHLWLPITLTHMNRLSYFLAEMLPIK